MANIFPKNILSDNLFYRHHTERHTPGKLLSATGYCFHCKKEHRISDGDARIYCHYLMKLLSQEKRIDLASPREESNPIFSSNYLFGEARGQMFGVLLFQRQDGSKGVIPAFSGQYNGQWELEGWAPPLLDSEAFQLIIRDVDREIKIITQQMAMIQKNSLQWRKLRLSRKKLSQKLMRDIHGLYRVHNFKGETKSIFEIFQGKNGIPSGTGDCCAPKLLNFAAQNRLQPLGLAEFYWGKESSSGTRKHSQFYSSCQTKCAPILGFMLCGLTKV